MDNLSFNEISFIVTTVILCLTFCLLLVMLIRGHSNNAYFMKNQAELAGRLTQMSEHNSFEQNKIEQAIAEQKLSLLKIIDEKLLQVTQNVGQGLQQSTAKNLGSLMTIFQTVSKISRLTHKNSLT